MVSPAQLFSSQVVPGSKTLGEVQESSGGLAAYLCGANMTKKSMTRLRVFMRSLAAYSVASYVLGFGDRHNDNVMLHRATGGFTRRCNHKQQTVASHASVADNGTCSSLTRCLLVVALPLFKVASFTSTSGTVLEFGQP